MDHSLELLDVLSELIYMRDLKSYELVYLNHPGTQLFGVPSQGDGRTCYEILQGRQSPCPFCPEAHLSDDHTYTWEFYNEMVQRYYLLKDRIMEFQGRTVHFEIAFDITEQKEQQKRMGWLSHINDTMVRCAKELYGTQKMQESMQEIVHIMGTSMTAQRAYVFEIQGETMSNTYEWCADGIEPMKDALQQLDVGLMERWMAHFRRKECVILEDLERIKDESPEEYAILKMQGVHSLMAGPLWVEGELVGYIGVDNPPKETMEWATELFDTLCYFLSAGMQNYEHGIRLRRLSYYDGLTGAQNRNRYVEQLAQQRGQKISKVGVLFLDLNGLKRINDTLGHEGGDDALKRTARVLEQCFDKTAIYRIGGDEFVVLAQSMEQADFMARLQKLETLFTIHSDLHIAKGHCWTESTNDLEALVSEADHCMYADKRKFYRDWK